MGWAGHDERCGGVRGGDEEITGEVSHVASKSASAWDLTLKYGEAPLPSESHGGGIVRGGQSARTIRPGLEFSLVLQLLSGESAGLLVARNEMRNHTVTNSEAIRLLCREQDLKSTREPGNKHLIDDTAVI